jgi:hypothetical protein
MKTTTILEILAAAFLAAGQAQAAPVALDHAVITATYQGQASGMLGLDHGFQADAGSNTTALDPTDSGVEFITADGQFAFDFSRTGLLTIWDNLPAPGPAVGNYAFTFDFGATLPASIGGFTLVDAGMVSGLPGLTVLNGHSIGLNLSGLTWNGDYGAITAQIDAVDGGADVPEPASLALMLAGAAGLFSNRKRRVSRTRAGARA